MKAEEKQALIDTAKEDIEFLESVRARRGHLFELEEQKLALIKIALSALTAQPVKQPQTHDAHGFPEPSHIINSRWIDSIREAGYEVQE